MYKFQPILKSLIWGGEKIAPYKGIATDQRNIGESWAVSYTHLTLPTTSRV